MRGIRLLHERGLPLSLKTVAVTINKHEVFAMQQFAEDELGVAFKFDAMMNPRLDCSRAPLGVRLTPEECVSFDVADPKRMDEWTTFGKRARATAAATVGPAEDLYGCGGGIMLLRHQPLRRVEHLHAVSEGFVRPEVRQLCGRLELVPAHSAVAKSHASDQVHQLPAEGMCGMCPANGELESGDARAPVDFLCRTAHLRALVRSASRSPPRRVQMLRGRKRV